MENIRVNLEEVRSKIAAACARAHRRTEEVTLVAVSKTYPAEAVCEAIACGQTVFGENRVQELRDKVPAVSALLQATDAEARYGNAVRALAEKPFCGLSWHLIGTLQSNKVKYLPELLTGEIHSVDNEKLAQEISRRFAADFVRIADAENRGTAAASAVHAAADGAESTGKAENGKGIFLEVNMAGEETKMGLVPADTEALLRTVAALPHIRVCGLMTIAPYTDDPESNRRYFSGLRELMEQLNAKEILPYRMTSLSMGMTGDYEVAIEEGATHVRVGTGIFGARNYT